MFFLSLNTLQRIKTTQNGILVLTFKRNVNVIILVIMISESSNWFTAF